ncbi:methyl-accepting chemotaxis protein [Paucibacter sp. DJ2R-2]|uniref:methyl-accepting chemotaxis protein n=1 Tax=Paucibacter sp. DJ2R-2 TaxID=2893558 RepID=UPI0021E3EB93|nr:methyl-accepting chemotaxis protein [Paucibacter sp. DJ2R-2]MCV2421866.1 methyl-accepting chemotaxis protein [Paucibacter sp. DJ4R-1]MCV2439517.1 methyl-accepting chemotaxis protein [Paucibacter sp. DJ2R-2]
MNAHPALQQGNRAQDRFLLTVIAANALLAIGLGYGYEQLGTALMLSLGCLLSGGAALHFWSGQPICRRFLATLLVLLVVTQLQISRGDTTIHANVYVTLCLMLPYGDWKLIAYAGALLIAHHLGFEALSSAATPLFVHETDSRLAGIADIGFILVLAGFLIHAAIDMHRRASERFELEFLVNAMGRDGPIRLNLDVVRTDSAVGQRLKHVQGRMAAALRQVRDATVNVHGVAQEVGDSSGELMARTDRTANGLKDAAMCLEQITVIVQESARASKEARELSHASSALAVRGGAVVTQMVNTMEEIDKSSRRITDIIGTIDAIAFQTNILALNAAVEAARAGEQGRGFAVVASEVRRLAGRSAEAAREIKNLISASIETVERGTHLASTAGSTMEELVSSVKSVGAVFESLTADNAEHAQGIEVVAASVKELDEVTRQNVHVAERSGQIADELQQQAAALAEVLSTFRLGDDAAVNELLRKAQQTAAAAASKRQERSQPTTGGSDAGGGSNIDFF